MVPPASVLNTYQSDLNTCTLESNITTDIKPAKRTIVEIVSTSPFKVKKKNPPSM